MKGSFRIRVVVLSTVCFLLFIAPVSAQCVVQAYFSPYDNIETEVVKRLAEAKETVHCSLYGISNAKITTTLKALLGQGVEVKLCLDKTQSAGKHSTHRQLVAAGADVVIKKTGVLEHNKFCIVDNARVLMGSWNQSASAQKQDNTMVELSACDATVQQFEAGFQRIHERDQQNWAGPMTAGHRFAQALKLLHAGASQDALEALTKAIQLDPEFAEAYAYRGFAYYQQGNYDTAMENYDKAVALWPNLAEAYYFRAILHGQLKDHEKAINDYSRVIELKPTLIDAYYFRALNHGAAGNYEEALRDMKTAAELGYEPAIGFLESHKATPQSN